MELHETDCSLGPLRVRACAGLAAGDRLPECAGSVTVRGTGPVFDGLGAVDRIAYLGAYHKFELGMGHASAGGVPDHIVRGASECHDSVDLSAEGL